MKLEDIKILIVEDDLPTLMLLKDFLKDFLKEVYTANNGIEGLETYKKHAPDIILADIDLPKLNGLEMVKKIKEENSEIPILILSALDDKTTLIDTINIGVSSFMQKPVNLIVLLDKLNKISKYLIIKKMKQEKLNFLVNHDVLTKLKNRCYFQEKLNQALSNIDSQKNSMSIIYIDIDNFKLINDTYGHLVGDEVLKMTSKRMRNSLREGDTIARLGGDEFCILIEKTTCIDSVKKIAQKILSYVSQDITVGKKSYTITCSMGVVVFSKKLDINTLISIADKAMYKAKKSGKNRYFIVDKTNK